MPASLQTLPTELLRLIIELAVPPESLVFAAAKARREALLALTRVDKRLYELAQPLLRKVVLVESVKQSERLRAVPEEGRRDASRLVIALEEDYVGLRQEEALAWNGIGGLMRILPCLDTVSFEGPDYARRQVYCLVDFGSDAFTRLRFLRLSHCRLFNDTDALQSCSNLVSLHLVSSAPGPDLFATACFPALRFLRITSPALLPGLLTYVVKVGHQLRAVQLDFSDPLLTMPLLVGTSLYKFDPFQPFIDRVILAYQTEWMELVPPNPVRHLLFPANKTPEPLEIQRLSEPFPSLEALFVSRRWTTKPIMADSLLALASTGAKLILVDSEEGEYDFILPEFERYLEAKQQLT